jgi:hypothetical protein
MLVRLNCYKMMGVIGASILTLPPPNVSPKQAVLMRKGNEDDAVEAGTLHA